MLVVTLRKSFEGIRGEWLWEVKDAKNKRVLASSSHGCVKLTDARKDFETVMGIYAPAVGKDETEVSWLVKPDYRSHKYIKRLK